MEDAQKIDKYIKDSLRNQGFQHSKAKLVLKDYGEYAKAVAEAYELAPTVSSEVVGSYKSLANHTNKMFKQLLTRFNIEFKEEDSYKSFKHLKKEVEKTGLLKVYKGGDAHPLWTPEQNWMFRAVHDLLGHLAGSGHSFSLRGEIAAYNQHLKIIPAKAVPALFSEVVGQICFYYVNNKFATQKACYLHGFDFYNIGMVEQEQAVAGSMIKNIDAEDLSRNDESLSVYITSSIRGINMYKKDIVAKVMTKLAWDDLGKSKISTKTITEVTKDQWHKMNQDWEAKKEEIVKKLDNMGPPPLDAKQFISWKREMNLLSLNLEVLEEDADDLVKRKNLKVV